MQVNCIKHPALISGNEKVHVPMYHGAGRSVEQIENTFIVGQGAYSAATANTRAGRRDGCLPAKGPAVIARACKPDSPIVLALNGLPIPLALRMPSYVDVAAGVGRD